MPTCVYLVFAAVNLRGNRIFLQNGTMHLLDYNVHTIRGATTNLLSVPTWRLKTSACIELSHAEKISDRGFTSQLEHTWACKFHVPGTRLCKERRGGERKSV